MPVRLHNLFARIDFARIDALRVQLVTWERALSALRVARKDLHGMAQTFFFEGTFDVEEKDVEDYPSEPQIDEPRDEIATYRDPPRIVEYPKPVVLTFWQRFANYFRRIWK